MKIARYVVLSLLLATLLPAAEPPKKTLEQLSEEFLRHVTELSADSMEGRGLGTAGLARAASWIEARLESIGLQPAFKRSYRQPFQIKTGVALREGNRLSGVAESDWTPLGFSSPGSFSGELVFAGYGIDAPPIGYEELRGLDLRGKVVLMLRYEPQEKDEASPFDGRRPSRWSSVRYKVHQARERGAAAVIFVTGPLQDDEKDKLPPLRNEGPESPAGLPVIQLKTSAAARLLAPLGVDLEEFQKAVDRDLKPRSVASPRPKAGETPALHERSVARAPNGLRIDGNVALTATFAEAANLAGIIPGKGALAGETIVVGAHYDHLGFGGEGSMRPNERAIHNGADDNASGAESVLLAAQELKAMLAPVANHRTVIVCLFAGEEVGLAGSAYFVANPPRPVSKIVGMINLDMVGRLRENRLIAFGAESAPEWGEAIDKVASAATLDVTRRGDGYGPSDQTSFYAARIPVLHLFTGSHEQYHTADDDASTLNAGGAAKVVDFTSRLMRELAVGSLTPKYARAQAAPAMGGDSRGYGAYLGTIPDYRAMEDASGGVLLGDVRPGGPADQAGIRGGDRIISMAGTRIENLYDMTFALQDHKPGETIEVVILRGGERVALRATLGKRGEQPAQPAASVPHEAPKPAQPAPHEAEARRQKAEIHPFYEDRPGDSFEIRAGKPFEGVAAGEQHLREIRQLTFGGENAEAYFSPDGRRLIFQATLPGQACDQEYLLDLGTGATTKVSRGGGRTTCGYFDWPEADRLIYASTAAAGSDCPAPPDRSKGYVWAVYDSFDLYEAQLDGSEPRRLTTSPGYDAEATWCHRGGKLVFTSNRDGDLDLYEMDEAGEVRRLTNTAGYDGGAFYSPDCSEIVWRASRPSGKDLDDYRALLARGLVRPTAMDLFVMKARGSEVRQITSNGAANFCPYFHPDGERIIFSSNVGSKSGREFDLWMVGKQGGEPERITSAEGFDGFPMFSPDGRYLVWASNRANPAGRETNLFVARWVE